MTFGKYGIDAVLPLGNRIDPNGIVETSSPKEIVSEIFILSKFIESNLSVFPGTIISIFINESKSISSKLL